MKFSFIYVAMVIIAMLATVLACAWLAQRNAKGSRRVRIARAQYWGVWAAFWWDRIAGVPIWFKHQLKYGRLRMIANAFTPTVHEKNTTKFTSVTIATRYLLFKADTADTNQRKVVVCTAQDRAMFVVPDTIAQADLDLTSSLAPVNAIMLGTTNDSIPMVAAGALNVGDVVYPATGGKCNTYVGLGSTGTNYACGVVIGSPSAADGDLVEVMGLLSVTSSTT